MTVKRTDGDILELLFFKMIHLQSLILKLGDLTIALLIFFNFNFFGKIILIIMRILSKKFELGLCRSND